VTASCGVKLVALVPVPAAVVTDSVPVAAPFGTVAVILVADATVKLADRVPNMTLLAPKKRVPAIVTEAPVTSEAGVNEVIVGATRETRVNDPVLVAVPTGADVFVTLTGPLVAACGQANCSVFVPCFSTAAGTPFAETVELELNPEPLSVTVVP
jgi:hypothetical protein